jgi:hypothetical protein
MRARLPLLLALALVACRRDAPASPTPEPSPQAAQRPPAPAPDAGPAAPPGEGAEEVQLGSLLGIWRVVAVLPGAGATFAADDPRIVGALIDVYPERLAWSYLASKDFSPTDLCLGPVSGLIADAAIAGDVRTALAPALRRTGTDPGHLSRPHRWLCGDGGEWGDEAEFQVIGRDRMAMRWPGDLTLVLERIRRASGDPPALPPTGAFERR